MPQSSLSCAVVAVHCKSRCVRNVGMVRELMIELGQVKRPPPNTYNCNHPMVLLPMITALRMVTIR